MNILVDIKDLKEVPFDQELRHNGRYTTRRGGKGRLKGVTEKHVFVQWADEEPTKDVGIRMYTHKWALQNLYVVVPESVDQRKKRELLEQIEEVKERLNKLQQQAKNL